MRYSTILPLAAAASAFVIPDEYTAQQLAINPEPAHDDGSWWDNLPSIEDIRSSFEDTLSSTLDSIPEIEFEIPNFFSPATESERPGKGRKGHHGHHGHHGASNLTVYEAIKESKYTTKLAKLVDEYPDIVKVLNGTEHNITLFAPTDRAFEKIPEHHEKPSKEFIEKVLVYHVVPGLFPAGRVLASHTLPTALTEDKLGKRPQRLRVSVGLFGLRVNFYSKVVAANIFTSNGVIHGVDSILVPPPPAKSIISLFPQKFSTVLLATKKSELHKDVKDIVGTNVTGSTLFTPTNRAFEKLGPRANAFLFNTEKGLGYLRALLKYHIVINETLYSDEYYGKQSINEDASATSRYHVDLPTLLKDRSLSIDVARWGGLIDVKINGFTRVSIQDVVTRDGVIHVMDSLLIPPRQPHGADRYVDGEEIEVEDLIERLEPYLEKDGEHDIMGDL